MKDNPKRWFTTNEIAEFLNISHRAVKENTRKLIGNDLIQFQHRSTTVSTKNGNLRTVMKLYVKNNNKKVFKLGSL